MSIACVKGPQVSEQSADVERVLAPNFTLQRIAARAARPPAAERARWTALQ